VPEKIYSQKSVALSLPKTIYYIFISTRPKQWIKNILVFAGLFFAKDVFDVAKITDAFLAFIAFCLISGSVYLINDFFDLEKDAQHPLKKYRPLPSGKLSPYTAIVAALILMAVAIIGGFLLNLYFGIMLAVYVLLNLAYSVYFKRVVILDVMIIASGFMFRAVGGTLAIHEPVSSWFILCTIFLALFLALSKRRAELITLGENAIHTRKSLEQYDSKFLDQMITVVTTGCLMSYALYTLDEQTVAKFGHQRLLWTIPFVIYGLFRYLYMVYKKQDGEAPENAILGDRPLLVCIGLYALTVFIIIYF